MRKLLAVSILMGIGIGILAFMSWLIGVKLLLITIGAVIGILLTVLGFGWSISVLDERTR